MLALPREVKSFLFFFGKLRHIHKNEPNIIRKNPCQFFLIFIGKHCIFKNLAGWAPISGEFQHQCFFAQALHKLLFCKILPKKCFGFRFRLYEKKSEASRSTDHQQCFRKDFPHFCRYKRAHFPQTYRQQLRIKRKINVLTCKKSGKRENKYNAVPKRKNASIFSMAISQVPAFGMNRISRGLYAKENRAKPCPSPCTKIQAKPQKNGCNTVKPSTPPRSGPLHGVAKIVAKKPLKKASTAAFFCSRTRKFKTGK